ncbi:MAG: 2OG-Fe(II) oxygenase [Actinomycetota bacterium]|nr:2OG-Fe(II) oxygenase [Actinomycetota bacterium]
MAWHTDWNPFESWRHVEGLDGAVCRKLSVIVQLSDPDDYDGGRVVFGYGQRPSPAPRERGTVLVFPATLAHKVTPVTRGRRYSVTGFAYGPPLR